MKSNPSNKKANGAKGPPKRNNRPTKERQKKPSGLNAQQNSRPQKAVAAAYAEGQSGKAPRVQQSKDMIRIQHREFISNVVGSVNFLVSLIFAINPGIVASFPWLAGVAQNWESYRFRRLRLCYYTRTGSNVPGSVIMAHDPDASDGSPGSEQIMTTYEAVEEDAPWKDICLKCIVSTLNDVGPRKFVRTAPLIANQDIKLYDSGNLFVATVDGTAVPWGKLWIEYDVELYTPQTPPTGLIGVGSMSGSGVAEAAATPFGTGPTSLGSFGLGASATNVVSFSGLAIGGEYQCIFAITGTVITACSLTTLVGGTLKATQFSGFPAAATTAAAIVTFIATATSGSITASVTATTVTISTFTMAALSPQPAY